MTELRYLHPSGHWEELDVGPGSTGATGPDGPVGATGADGPKGPRGATGSKGLNGPVGDRGPVGDLGPDGGKGPAGGQGGQGPPGAQGPNHYNWFRAGGVGGLTSGNPQRVNFSSPLRTVPVVVACLNVNQGSVGPSGAIVVAVTGVDTAGFTVEVFRKDNASTYVNWFASSIR